MPASRFFSHNEVKTKRSFSCEPCNIYLSCSVQSFRRPAFCISCTTMCIPGKELEWSTKIRQILMHWSFCNTVKPCTLPFHYLFTQKSRMMLFFFRSNHVSYWMSNLIVCSEKIPEVWLAYVQTKSTLAITHAPCVSPHVLCSEIVFALVLQE